jgi:hypothetical protein
VPPNPTQFELFYNNRQYAMPDHIAAKIARHGASRNLIVRNAKPEMTHASIREDLHHIHCLEVVDVNFLHGDAIISLNDVHKALTARTCMISHINYRGCRIDFYPDECDQPLPQVSKRSRGEPAAAKTGLNSNSWRSNRFALLKDEGMDEWDGDDVAEETMQPANGLGRGMAALKVAA